jgi:hypothetical protein
MTAQGVKRLAPPVAAVLLCVLLATRLWEQSPNVGTEAYMARVAEEVDSIPYRIGDYVGVDGQVTPGVIELLKPNRILQRQYTDPESGEGFSLILVHCGIAKDMTGHYPPNCYPRAGWVESSGMETLPLELTDVLIPARLYHFRLENDPVPAGLDILSFFVVPSGPQRFGPDIRLVDMASRSPSASLLGAGQVQILTSQDLPDERREHIWKLVIQTIYPALSEIAEGVQ